jgi:peptide-methionine (R)-S-oxide reductase
MSMTGMIRILALPLLIGVISCDDISRTTEAAVPLAQETSPPTTAPAGVKKVVRTKQEWKMLLPEMTYRVMFEAQTERACDNAYFNHKGKGTYVSAATGVPLFRSEDKYDSGTGWPSFTKPITPDAVEYRREPDGRIEVIDASSGGHLGHVFDDGPPPTGKRFCMNSAAMRFIPDEPEDQ